MTVAYGSRMLRVLALLERAGPHAAVEVALELGMTRHNANNALRRLAGMVKSVKPLERRVHIYDWATEMEGHRPYLYPVYAAGNYPDKSRPAGYVRARKVKERYEAAAKVRRTHNFVFNLGGSRERSAPAQH